MSEVKITSAELSPHHLRMVYRLEGTEEALQGVKQWAQDTWGTGGCQGFSRKRQLNTNRPRLPKTFMYSRPQKVETEDRFGVKRIATVSGPSGTQPLMKIQVAIWGKDASALFKLRWA